MRGPLSDRDLEFSAASVTRVLEECVSHVPTPTACIEELELGQSIVDLL